MLWCWQNMWGCSVAYRVKVYTYKSHQCSIKGHQCQFPCQWFLVFFGQGLVSASSVSPHRGSTRWGRCVQNRVIPANLDWLHVTLALLSSVGRFRQFKCIVNVWRHLKHVKNVCTLCTKQLLLCWGFCMKCRANKIKLHTTKRRAYESIQALDASIPSVAFHWSPRSTERLVRVMVKIDCKLTHNRSSVSVPPPGPGLWSAEFIGHGATEESGTVSGH